MVMTLYLQLSSAGSNPAEINYIYMKVFIIIISYKFIVINQFIYNIHYLYEYMSIK